jgi:uncharacterized repeat protein (TIGR02543 family)
VSIPEAPNAQVLQNLNLLGAYPMPVDVVLGPAQLVETVHFGYISGDTPTYNVTYHGNGNTGGSAPVDPNDYPESANVMVMGAGDLERAGFSFVGWNTQADGSGTWRQPADSFAMPAANVDLYAQWSTDPTYNVTYHGNGNTGGGVPVDANDYLEGASVTVLGPDDLERDGHSFTGWNTEADGSGTGYQPGGGFSMPGADVDLHAQWQEVLVGEIRGHVFLDVNGNAVKDPGEPNLADIEVRITDAESVEYIVYTDSYGDFAADVAAGAASIEVIGPVGYTLTTANHQQVIEVIADQSVTADDVGYRLAETADRGSLAGRVFLDNNGNGQLDPGEPDFAWVWVTVTTVDGDVISLQTTLQGDFSLEVPAGATGLQVMTPEGYELTTANDNQTVTVPVDGATAAAPVGYVPAGNPGSGELTGLVFLDENQNGMFDAGESGLAGVSVRIEANGGAVFTLLSMVDGSFAALLPPGNAELTVTDPDGLILTTANRDQTVAVVQDQATEAGPIGYFDPSAGEAQPAPVPVPSGGFWALLLLLSGMLWIGLASLRRRTAT